MKVNFKITDHDVKIQLEGMTNKLEVELERTIEDLTYKLQAKIKNEKLSGQVLKVRSGKLKNSILTKTVKKKKGEFKGVVSTKTSYAGIHEYGFNGSVVVKAHLRNIKQAFGKPISPREVAITTFSRKMNMPERSFMRSALKDMQAEIFSQVEATVESALK